MPAPYAFPSQQDPELQHPDNPATFGYIDRPDSVFSRFRPSQQVADPMSFAHQFTGPAANFDLMHGDRGGAPADYGIQRSPGLSPRDFGAMQSRDFGAAGNVVKGMVQEASMKMEPSQNQPNALYAGPIPTPQPASRVQPQYAQAQPQQTAQNPLYAPRGGGVQGSTQQTGMAGVKPPMGLGGPRPTGQQGVPSPDQQRQRDHAQDAMDDARNPLLREPGKVGWTADGNIEWGNGDITELGQR
jgi:hypothetical protein